MQVAAAAAHRQASVLTDMAGGCVVLWLESVRVSVGRGPGEDKGSGIGVHFIVTPAHMVSITGFVAGGPAARDGRLRAGDVVMAVDSVVLRPDARPTSEMVAELILGPEGSAIDVTGNP